MSLETVLGVLGLALVALLAWRETRVRRVSQLAKANKALKKRVDQLEEVVSGLPGAEVVADLEQQLASVAESAAASPPNALRALVERVNVVSNDVSALKVVAETSQKRLDRLEQGQKWASALKKEG